MNERQLNSFIQAAEFESFTSAAKHNYISTQALSGQINSLEKDIGFSLFERSPGGVKLTKSGEDFYRAAKEIIRIYEEACESGRKAEKKNQTVIHIVGGIKNYPAQFADFCKEFQKENPSIKVKFSMMDVKDQFEAIESGDMTICFCAEPESTPKSMKFYPLFEDYYTFCMNGEIALSDKKLIHIEDLSGYTVHGEKKDYKKVNLQKLLEDKKIDYKVLQDIREINVLNLIMENQIIGKHSRWCKSFPDFIKRIPSDISAGKIGMLCKQEQSESVRGFIEAVLNKYQVKA